MNLLRYSRPRFAATLTLTLLALTASPLLAESHFYFFKQKQSLDLDITQVALRLEGRETLDPATLRELERIGLDTRIGSGALPPVADLAVAARFIIECIATWAVHIHWDPSPQSIAPEAAEQTVVELVVRSLTGGSR